MNNFKETLSLEDQIKYEKMSDKSKKDLEEITLKERKIQAAHAANPELLKKYKDYIKYFWDNWGKISYDAYIEKRKEYEKILYPNE